MTGDKCAEFAEAQKHVGEISGRLVDVSRKVWEFAEVGLQENRSAAVQVDFLESEGFSVKQGTGGMPSAFVAEWGSGKPVIGFLGEYDALMGLSQKAVAVKDPVCAGAPGHGCGHNLLGAAALGSAVALKRYLTAHSLPGTVRYYGCPAEETLIGKVFMARDGAYDDLDVAITWHPGAVNTVQLGSSNGVNSVKFTFHGKTAHAAGDPHNGRSALDAVELMNVGANYLREHVISDARLHYVITDGGGQPNVVPATAQVWYYVRAPHRPQVEEIYSRLIDVAKGAALMTGTTFDIEFLAGCYDVLPNDVLAGVCLDVFKALGAPKWSAEEMQFAEDLAKSLDRKQVQEGLKAQGAPKELLTQVVNITVLDPMDKGKVMAGSTDVGDVSWIVPTVQISAACWPVGSPGHSWQVASSSGHPFGEKGMLKAAEVMAGAAVAIVADPSIIEKAKAEFAEKLAGEKYISPLPAGSKAPMGQFK
ncbi:MAG: M20 family metallopeptidase [Bacillota bacterium]